MKKRVNISLSDHILKDLDDLALSHGLDRSAMITVLIAKEYGYRVDKEAMEGLEGFDNYKE